MHASNADRDVFARFAYVRALAAGTPAESLAALVSHASRSVRLGAALALREQKSERVAVFLADPDAQVATEAARAAYDLQLPAAMRSLAATLPTLRAELRTEPWLRRALHAALRTGAAAQAEAVAAFAADGATSEAWRLEALDVLARWDAPGPRDGVWARWQPLPARKPGRHVPRSPRPAARAGDRARRGSLACLSSSRAEKG